MEIPETKKCTVCHEEKSVTQGFSKGSGKYGRCPQCKDCDRRRTAIYSTRNKAANVVKTREQLDAQTKKCSACDRVLLGSLFGRDVLEVTGLRSRCKDCEKDGSDKVAAQWRSINQQLSREHLNTLIQKCTQCKETLSGDKFSRQNGRPSGLQGACISCQRRNKRIERYGISVEQYDAMLVEQNNQCKLCFTNLVPKMTDVDHCHDSLRVRGILCRSCNLMLGMSNDDPDVLRRAAEYVTIS